MTSKLQINFFYIILIAVLILTFFVFLPYFKALFLAVVLAVIFYPLFLRLRALFWGGKTLAALLSVLIILVIIIGPLMLLGYLLFGEIKNVYDSLAYGSGIDTLMAVAGKIQMYLNKILPADWVPEFSDVDIQLRLTQLYSWAGGNVQQLFNNIISFAVSCFVFIFALFFFLRDGDMFRQTMMRISPLNNQYDQTILSKMASAINSVVKGSLFLAILQGLLAALGFTIFGFPSPIIWGIITMFAALIPSVGTALIIVPASLYLAVTGGFWQGVGLLIWGTAVVGLIDNVFKPFVFERGIKIHSFLILLSALGGVSFFGIIGLLAGPIMLALLFALMEIHSRVLTEN